MTRVLLRRARHCVGCAPQAIPATGVIDYRYVPVELNLDKDVWVSG